MAIEGNDAEDLTTGATGTAPTRDTPEPGTSAVGAAHGTSSLYPNDSRVPGHEAADASTSRELGNAAPAVGPTTT